jgi:hypothetical protein
MGSGSEPASKGSPVVPLTTDDLQIIHKLIDSPMLSDEEKTELEIMRKAGSKGAYEQENLGAPSRIWPFY